MRGQFLPGTVVGRRSLLHELAQAERIGGDRLLFRWANGEESVGKFAQRVRRYATGLRKLGVRAGDRVATLALPSVRYPALWCAIAGLDAIEVPINSQLRGPILEHVLRDADPQWVLGESAFLEPLEQFGSTLGLQIINISGALESDWLKEPEGELHDPEASETAAIVYTSGTTGPSKGVVLAHGYFPNFGELWHRAFNVQPGEVFYFAQPFFHVDIRVIVAMCLISRSALAFAPKFSASRFWFDVQAMGATWFGAVGAMFSAIAKHDPPPSSQIKLTRGIGAPIPEDAYAYFEDQLDIDLLCLYGQTEADGVVFDTADRRDRGACGWTCGGFDVEIHSPDGRAMSTGETGEIVYRPLVPNMMLKGYWRRDDATVASFRDMWFHSGDLGRFDDNGLLRFVGRAKDVIRRRGENISAYEVELTIQGCDGVRECAAVAVRDVIGDEDEVKVFLVLDDGAAFCAKQFFVYCRRMLPNYAVPRFVEIVSSDSAARSAGTGAIQKHLLPRANGPAVIDRQIVESVEKQDIP